ncbi:sialidase family protein [Gracilibacillus alcaliphilus]|nr:sialidase-1 [Gracilibacillus alcaliphilus]
MMNKIITSSPEIDVYKPGEFNSKAYRIPAMITSKKGTVIASIDARIVDLRDNPNQIKTYVRRSEDNGDTWEDPVIALEYAGEGLDGAAAIDTALLEDEDTDTIWLLVSHTPGGIGLWNSEAGTGFNEQGQRVLTDTFGNTYYLQEDGAVLDTQGKRTNYFVDDKGYVFKDGIETGNIYWKKELSSDDSLLEQRTSYVQVIYSKDDGRTWSSPIDLNPAVKENWMAFIGAGPGRGIQLEQQDYRGRLLFPIYFSNEHRKMSCAVIYSDDHGKTWKRSSSPNDGRIFENEPLAAKDLAVENADLTESQLIELRDGTVRVFMRNHSGRQRIALSESRDGGMTWSEVTYHMDLLDPTCQSSVIRYPNDDQDIVLFANPADERERSNGTIRLSVDGGETWIDQTVINTGGFIYSCLTVLPNGEIAILYEAGDDDMGIFIKFQKFQLEPTD